MTLLELAERCEARSADEWPLIREAGLRVFGPGHKAFRRIQHLCDEKAFLDAAMTLVPEGHQFGAGLDNIVAGPEGWAWVTSEESYHLIRAVTPALALVSAALRARATLPEGEER